MDELGKFNIIIWKRRFLQSLKYVQSVALLLANVFENFRNMCLKIYELYAAKFRSAPGSA